MESVIQVIVFTLFGAGAVSWLGMATFWTATAFFGLTPEAKDRFWWNPYNGTLNQQNLTERGRWFRRLGIRCLILFFAFPMCGMIVGLVLMLAFGIQVEPRVDKNVRYSSPVVVPLREEAEQPMDSNPH